MSARLARLALRLYPHAYRRRYGTEMETLLEDTGAGPAAVVDLFRGAIGAHLRPEPAVADAVGREERLRRGLAAILLCWALFVVAGLSLYKTTEGRPFEGEGGTPGILGSLHLAIQILALVGLAAVLVGGTPLAVAVLRKGGVRDGLRAAARRSMAIELPARPLALASGCAAVVAAAMVGIAALTAAYLVVLAASAPNLAGEPNGPFGTPDVAVSLALQLAAMVAVAAPAALVAARARRTVAR